MSDQPETPEGSDVSEKPSPSPAGVQRGKFLIVGIGASAGGLEALSDLTKHVPADSMAFIVVQHLSPHHTSVLPQLLARQASLEVLTAADGMAVEANKIYVIPPNTDLAVLHGVLHLIAPPSGRGPRMPIDFLFRSLAEDQGPNAIGIVLSGTGTDGTFGLKAIKASGGITFAQDPSTAKYDGMPRSALASGATDYSLSPGDIGRELGRIAQQVVRLPETVPAATPALKDQLSKLFILIRAETGNDLTHYKQSTLDRRIERRMMLNKLGKLEDYVKFVQTNRDELHTLYKDMLISVTSFFRDPEAFESLKRLVFPQILKNREPHQPVRIWVPACATGEEPYSLAMALMEYCEEKSRDLKLQIFGTDIDDDSIQYARRGVYPANITLDVSPERLNRFFIKKDNEYLVPRRIRDMLVFSKQNLLKDAPFSRIDLVSCRNLLIYLQPAAQKRVLRILHYATNPSGYLFLGTSETVADAPQLFSPIDRKHKIYARKATALQPGLDVPFSAPGPLEPSPNHTPSRPNLSLQNMADRKVLDLYGPPGVLINADLEILQFRGHTGPFLDPAPGAASLNVLRVARFELHIELKNAIQQALARGQRVTTETNCPDEGKPGQVRLDVLPFQDPETNSQCLLVLFQRLPPPREVAGAGNETAEAAADGLAQRVQELERELAVTKEFLQTTIEEKESTLEELKGANEELQSSNEELQSTNEELETSKEEMQSTNEELTTVNEELQNRMAELSQTNDDLHNILSGVDNAVVIVGMDLKIRRYTGAAEKLFNLVPGDIGRSVGFLNPFLGDASLEPKAASVIQSLATLEEEVQATNERWYLLRITPYKTLDHSIRGALVSLIDVDVRRRAQEITRDIPSFADKFLSAIPDALLIVDRALRVVWVNDIFCSIFQVASAQAIGVPLGLIAARQFAEPALQKIVNGVFATATPVRNHEMKLGDVHARVGVGLVPAPSEAPLALLSIGQRGEIS